MHILVVCRLLLVIHSSLSSYITVAMRGWLFNLEMIKGCEQLCVGYKELEHPWIVLHQLGSWDPLTDRCRPFDGLLFKGYW